MRVISPHHHRAETRSVKSAFRVLLRRASRGRQTVASPLYGPPDTTRLVWSDFLRWTSRFRRARPCHAFEGEGVRQLPSGDGAT
jgi:hypothetical protein